jgi:hypothetical protein
MNGTGMTVDQPIKDWLIIGAMTAVGLLPTILMYRRHRGWSRRARVKRRLLVMKEDRQCVWHTVKGKLLVGWSDSNGAVTSGSWSQGEPGTERWRGQDWAVIQTKEKLVVYQFHDRNRDEPRTGEITVCNSWRELESLVPPKIFEEALLEAGIKKPSEYREEPLNL